MDISPPNRLIACRLRVQGFECHCREHFLFGDYFESISTKQRYIMIYRAYIFKTFFSAFVHSAGPVATYSGHDATRAMATMSMNCVKDEPDDLQDLTEQQWQSVQNWENRFQGQQ